MKRIQTQNAASQNLNRKQEGYAMKRVRFLALALALVISLVINQLSQADITPVSGEFPVLVILQCYKDSDTDTKCGSTFNPTQNANGPNNAPSYAPLTLADQAFYDRVLFGSKPSTRDLLLETSYKQFTIKKAAILGWYLAPQPYSYYWGAPKSATCSACDSNSHHTQKWTDAIKAADSDFNFAPYDKDGNGVIDHKELAIIVVSGTNRDEAAFALEPAAGAPITTNDCLISCRKVDGTVVEVYSFGAWYARFAHELLHNFGELPDLYGPDPDGKNTNPPDNKRDDNFTLMGQDRRHLHLDPWEKIKLGWLKPTQVTKDGTYTINNAEKNPEAYILSDPCHGNKEYFIVESRWPGTSYDADQVGALGMPGRGLAIWHIDETRLPNGREVVDLERAFDSSEDKALWDSSAYDLTDDSSPHHSRWNDDTRSRIAVRKISAVGTTMTATFEVPTDEYEALKAQLDAKQQELDDLKGEIDLLAEELMKASPGAKSAIVALIKKLQKAIDPLEAEIKALESALADFCKVGKGTLTPILPPTALDLTIGMATPIALPVCNTGVSHELSASWRASGGVAPVSAELFFTDETGQFQRAAGTTPGEGMPLLPEGTMQFRVNVPQGGTRTVKVEVTDAAGAKVSDQHDVTLNPCPTPGRPTGQALSVDVSAQGTQVCAESYSHELSLTWKVSGGTPPYDLQIEITAPDGQKETLGTDTLEGSRKFQLLYPGGGSVSITVTARDSSNSSSSAQSSVQLGKCQ